jgi:hypothetical protein
MSREATERAKVFDEIHSGKTYKKTKKKHGSKVANKQAVAIYFSKKRQVKKATRKRGVKK